MIAAHGARVTVTPTSVDIDYTPLMAALQHTSRSIKLADVTGTVLHEPNALLGGHVILEGAEEHIAFSPRQADQARQLVASISALLRGENPPMADSVPGLNFVAFDVETANADWGSICQIGAVKFVDGQITDSVSWLLTPPPGLNEFAADNIAIHGITPEMVAGQPDFPIRLKQLQDFVGDLPLVAHNAQFDFTALSRASLACNIAAPSMFFGCSLLMARSAQLGFENNRLPTVSAGLGVKLTKHHDATADAEACGGIVVALARRAGFSGSFPEFVFSQGFTMGILEPNRVYPVLRDRSGAGIAVQRKKYGFGSSPQSAASPTNTKKSGNFGTISEATVAEYATSAATVAPGLNQEKTTAHAAAPKATKVNAPWDRVATPEVIPDANPDADSSGPLFGQNVTLTGDFAPFEKGDLWQRIADAGGKIGKNVTKKTTMLVCGPWTTKTSKQKRAEELNSKGQDIAIWNEKQLYSALGLDEQPPF